MKSKKTKWPKNTRKAGFSPLSLIYFIFVLLYSTKPIVASAQPSTSLEKKLGSDDFRVRVQAVSALGQTKPANARLWLERALNDLHPAVRVAASVALGDLGDVNVLPALENAKKVEKVPSVQLQMGKNIHALRRSGMVAINSSKYALLLGKMRVPPEVVGKTNSLNFLMLETALHDSSRFQCALKIPQIVVFDVSDIELSNAAKAKHLPTFTLEAQLKKIDVSSLSGKAVVQVQVEFLIRRGNVLKASFSGRSGLEKEMSLADRTQLASLERQAIESAVESAVDALSSTVCELM